MQNNKMIVKIHRILILSGMELLLLCGGFLLWLIAGNEFVGIGVLSLFFISVLGGVIFTFWIKRNIPDSVRITISVIGQITTGFTIGVLLLPKDFIVPWLRICSIISMLLVLALWNMVLKPIIRARISALPEKTTYDSTKKKMPLSKERDYTPNINYYDSMPKTIKKGNDKKAMEPKNLFVLRENLSHRYACFDNGKVFAVDAANKHLIGYYDDDGTIYSDMKQQIGHVSGELIQMNRLGELEDVRSKLGEDAYFSLCRATNIAWTCAEVSLYPSSFGFIQEFLGGEPIGDPDRSLMEDQSAIGYAACFLCLEYFNGYNCGGKHARFYCPLGQYFIAPQ